MKSLDIAGKGVIFQSQSELEIPFEFGGYKGTVRDYSMGIVGPGERAKSEWKTARECGLETSAKVQVNTTWEGSTVPALPVFPLVEEHIRRLKDEGVRAPDAQLDAGRVSVRKPHARGKVFLQSGENSDGQ